jgi:hypothetical protein
MENEEDGNRILCSDTLMLFIDNELVETMIVNTCTSDVQKDEADSALFVASFKSKHTKEQLEQIEKLGESIRATMDRIHESDEIIGATPYSHSRRKNENDNEYFHTRIRKIQEALRAMVPILLPFEPRVDDEGGDDIEEIAFDLYHFGVCRIKDWDELEYNALFLLE